MRHYFIPLNQNKGDWSKIIEIIDKKCRIVYMYFRNDLIKVNCSVIFVCISGSNIFRKSKQFTLSKF